MEIEKTVPTPKTNGGRGAPRKYPFAEMEVGDSVFFEGERTGGKPYIAAQTIGRQKGRKFSGRKEEGGLRIWRIK